MRKILCFLMLAAMCLAGVVMADTFSTAVYKTDGGDTLGVEDGGFIKVYDGGIIWFEATDTVNTDPCEGYVYWDDSEGILKGWDGSQWLAFGDGTFVGGSMTTDTTLSNGVDLLSSEVMSQTNAIQVYDVDGTAYVDAFRVTNGNTGAIVIGAATASVAIASTGLDVSTGGAITNVTSIQMTDDITMANAKGVKSSVTTAQTVGVYGYDVDGTAYVGALVVTNGDTPATVIGNASGTTAITSSDWAIGTTGIATGLGNITTDGLVSTATNTYLLTKCVKYTIGDPTDTTADAQWAGDADTTEQIIDCGAIIPIYGRIIDAVIICTETVATGMTFAAEVGTSSSGAELIVSADCDDVGDVTETAAAGSAIGTVSSSAVHVYVAGTPTTANWAAMDAGLWTVIVTYVDYGAID